MAKAFDLQKQLKLHDNDLLRQLFTESGHLDDFDWDSLSPHQVAPIVEYWETMNDADRRHLEVIFHDVNELGDECGQGLLIEEIDWRFPKKRDEFGAQRGLLDKALWAYLHARPAFNSAAIFVRAESLRNGQYAKRWNGLPIANPKFTAKMKHALQGEVSSFYSTKQMRGRQCCVHHYSRANGAEFYGSPPSQLFNHDSAYRNDPAHGGESAQSSTCQRLAARGRASRY